MASRVLQGVLGRVDSAAIEQAASAMAAIDRRALDQMARTIDLVARNRKTADLAEGLSVVALEKQMRLTPGPLAGINEQLTEFSRAMWPGVGISKQLTEFSRAMWPGVGISKQLAELNRPLIRPDLFPAIPKIRFSPEWEQFWDDIDTAESFDPTVAALSEHEMETPIGVFAAELAVAALAGRIRRLGEIWSVPALVDAACQLEEEDARWRAVDDERRFANIIHRTVSVLEEVAWQAAYSHLDHERNPQVQKATFRGALKALMRRGAITRSQRERMIQAWDLRNKTRGAGHRVGRAPREATGFVLFRVRQGLRDLLDGVDVQRPNDV